MGHDPVARAEGRHRGADLGDRARALDARHMRHGEARIARDAAAHVEIEVVEAHGLQRDQDVVRADRGSRDFLANELLRPAMAVDDDGLHARRLPPIARGGAQAATSRALWRARGVSRITAAMSGASSGANGAR